MKKIDYKKEDKTVYQAKKDKVLEVDIPTFKFLMLNGEGDPNMSKIFMEACEALFSVSYKIKFAIKKSDLEIDYAVMPLEGLWWVEDGKFDLKDKSNWKWTLMVRQPDFITQQNVDSAIEAVQKKKQLDNLSSLKLESYHEGLSAQILHIGPYSEEQPTIDLLHHYIDENKYIPAGKHHEIYLSDPSRTAPEKLKTVIRQPMRAK